jgi:RNA polymerase sigma-70 factor (ECF subfamily)
MANTDSFAQLIDRLRAGENEAVRQVFELYVHRLHMLARGQLAQRFAHKIDPEDVVQSAYKSFVLRHRDGKLHVGNRKSLWNLLTLITLRKCADRVEYLRADRRDIGRQAAGGEEDGWRGAVDREPLPEEATVLAETVEQLFLQIEADERPILELSLQGYTAPEISAKLGRAERSVRRLRERVRKRLEAMQAEA